MSNLRVGIIGATGGIGKLRCQYFTESPASEIVAVCARTPEAVREIAEQYGARSYYIRWEDLVADPDVTAVSVASSNASHYAITRAALEAGKHVCVEYPLAQNVEQYDELFGIAEARQVILHDALTVRAEALHNALRNNFDRIGIPVWAHYRYYGGGTATWYIDPEPRGNPFIALHIHFIEQQIDFFGQPKWIEATQWETSAGGKRISGNVMMGFRDAVTGYMEFGMGFPANPSYQITYLGSDGFLEFNNRKLNLHTADGVEAIEIGENRALKLDTDNFVAQALSGEQPLSSPVVGRRAIELCLAATRSATENQRVEV